MEAASKKILAIRSAAGNDCTTCPTCTRPASSPYRRQDAAGRIVEGCIDAAHTPALPPTTSTHAWHFRPAAVALRRETAARLASL